MLCYNACILMRFGIYNLKEPTVIVLKIPFSTKEIRTSYLKIKNVDLLKVLSFFHMTITPFLSLYR